MRRWGRASQLSTPPLWGVDRCAGRRGGGELRPFCLSGNCGRCSAGYIPSVCCAHLSDAVVSLGIKKLSWVRPAASDQWLRPFSDARLETVSPSSEVTITVVVYSTLCVAHHSIGWEVACSVDEEDGIWADTSLYCSAPGHPRVRLFHLSSLLQTLSNYWMALMILQQFSL